MIALSIFGHIAFRSVALVSIRTKIGALQRIEGGCCCKGNRWRGRAGDLVERSYPLVVGAMKSADTVDGGNSDDYYGSGGSSRDSKSSSGHGSGSHGAGKNVPDVSRRCQKPLSTFRSSKTIMTSLP